MRKGVKRVAVAFLFALPIAVLMPVLIWVAIALVSRELWMWWRLRRLPVATDLRRGYASMVSRYMPQH